MRVVIYLEGLLVSQDVWDVLQLRVSVTYRQSMKNMLTHTLACHSKRKECA